jgi:uncharacterized protein YbjT (DUF2867 family)
VDSTAAHFRDAWKLRRNQMNTGMTLVLGATGKTGRRIMERLAAKGVPVRAGSRSAQPSFDWENRATWAAALSGVDKVYVSYYPDLAAPGATDAIRAFSELAVKMGVRRIVLLSGRGEAEAQAAEEIVRNCGIEWTLLRASWFNQNFSENFMLDGLLAGELVLPAGNVGEPFIDTNDIADAAVAALTEDRHVGQLYEITGPRLLSFAEAVAEIARASGRTIRYTQVSSEQYAASLKEASVPPEFVSFLSYLFDEVLDGRNAFVTDGVQRVLGRAPRDFADYARETAATGVWSPAK